MHEERAIYAGLVIVSAPLVAIAAARGTTIGATETIAGLCTLAGLVGLWPRSRIPRARLRR